MQNTITAEMRFAFQNEKKAENALKTLEPELSGKHEKRSKTTASIKKNILAISISAEDLGALKTTMNSYSKATAFIREITRQ